VVLMPEIPGIHPAVLGLGNHLVDNGFTVVIPSLFGTPGKAKSAGYIFETMARVCVSREFQAFATGARRPVASFIRALASDLNSRAQGSGVGVIGMCLSGGFALAAAVDDVVLAAVMSQPAVPLPLTPTKKRDPGVSSSELDAVLDRSTSGAVCMIGLRFTKDWKSPEERFTTLSDRLKDAFRVIPIDSSCNNPYGFRRGAHSVLTDEVREQAGHPAFEAREQVVAFLMERLCSPS
jgi:dienelactone hydrolase